MERARAGVDDYESMPWHFLKAKHEQDVDRGSCEERGTRFVCISQSAWMHVGMPVLCMLDTGLHVSMCEYQCTYGYVRVHAFAVLLTTRVYLSRPQK